MKTKVVVATGYGGCCPGKEMSIKGKVKEEEEDSLLLTLNCRTKDGR
jgi:hypothetical protein